MSREETGNYLGLTIESVSRLPSRLKEHFARVALGKAELRDGLVLAGAALVVRPLLPDASSGWLLGVNPKTLWTLVILIMSIQTAAMGVRCGQDSGLRKACVTGALLSNTATFVLLWVVAITIAPAHLGQLAPSLACGLLAAVALAAAARPHRAPRCLPC